MLLAPVPLAYATLDKAALEQDVKACRHFGPCGVGEKAVYLNNYFFDRHYYIPVGSITRVYKRVAMSKGGFTGKGVFGSIPYVVVEYDGGKTKQATLKYEDEADMLLACVAEKFPRIKTVSEAAEKRLAEKAAREAAKPHPVLTEKAISAKKELEQAKRYLEAKPEIGTRLSSTAKAKRINNRTNPAYKWVALAIFLLGFGAFIWGVYTMFKGDRSGLYPLLLGLAAVFLFSSSQVLPTQRNNAGWLQKQLESAQGSAEGYLKEYPGAFPVPARYAHPIVLERMIRIIKEGRAESGEEALDLLKSDLKALNKSVQVEQEEYDEVVAIKPMFLLADYQ